MRSYRFWTDPGNLQGGAAISNLTLPTPLGLRKHMLLLATLHSCPDDRGSIPGPGSGSFLANRLLLVEETFPSRLATDL